jgi:hypothetical protein
MRATFKRTQSLWFFGFFMLVGYMLTGIVPAQSIREWQYYPLILNVLLGIGLYASVRGIDHADLREGKRSLLLVTTLGVAAKIVIIGSIVYFVTKSPLSFVFAIVVAQIDPLSISALTLKGNYQLSSKAKNILLVWASFDDPVTVIAAIVVAQYIYFTDLSLMSSGWYWQLGNIIFPALVYVFYKHTLHGRNRYWLEIGLLLVASAISILFGWMLSIALLGLFLRPALYNIEDLVVTGAYIVSLLFLGSYLTQGVDFWLGIVLAVAAITAQIIAALVFMSGLPKMDRAYLACAQQNGITAVILSLLFVRISSDIMSVVIVAILFINLVHIITFSLLDMYVTSTKNKNSPPSAPSSSASTPSSKTSTSQTDPKPYDTIIATGYRNN